MSIKSLLIMFVITVLFLNSCKNANNKSVSKSKSNAATQAQSGKTLTFVVQKQDQKKLCWAAVTSSVSKFYNSNSQFTQCNLANQAFGTDICCKNIADCNRGYILQGALSFTHNFESEFTGMPTFDRIKNEITNGRLVCIAIKWRDDSKLLHDVVIHGYHDNGDVDVQDPWPDKNPGRIPFVELQHFYDDVGEINRYLLTKPEFSLK